MIIGFLGKGGSGKSTLSAAFTAFLLDQQKTVLAIDADHNMDFAYRLGNAELPYFFGTSIDEIKKYSGIDDESHYREALLMENPKHFSLKPADEYTKKYSVPISENLSIMAAGPHTETILQGEKCSHMLFTPLKIYLPLLKLNPDEYAIVDQPAGSDGAGTGIPSGFSFAFIVAEPTPYGIKSSRQIADILDFYKTPYEIVLNKATARSLEATEKLLPTLSKKPRFTFMFNEKLAFGEPDKDTSATIRKMHDAAREYVRLNGDRRLERSIEKSKKNLPGKALNRN